MNKFVQMSLHAIGVMACAVLVSCCIVNIFWQMYGYIEKATNIYDALF